MTLLGSPYTWYLQVLQHQRCSPRHQRQDKAKLLVYLHETLMDTGVESDIVGENVGGLSPV